MEDVYKKYTKYEVARILGARALQISMNAPLLLNISQEKLEEMDFNPLKIAEMEFEADILPITVKRPLPQKTEMEEEEEVEELEIEDEVVTEKPAVVEEKEEKVEAPAAE
ncbi:MAG: DNA-directed RNA polymerase subunit K [Nanoarchaeota archaeon]|nr:DNA-directed RNA polymerase subunit K [Nanoarchaeota archaeon]